MRVLAESDWIMPVSSAAYCYVQKFTADGWLRKMLREETAGFEAAGVSSEPSLKSALAKILRAQAHVLGTARVEAALYLLRRRMRARLAEKVRPRAQ